MKASSRHGGNSIKEIARKKSGKLFSETVKKLEKFLGGRGWAALGKASKTFEIFDF